MESGTQCMEIGTQCMDLDEAHAATCSDPDDVKTACERTSLAKHLVQLQFWFLRIDSEFACTWLAELGRREDAMASTKEGMGLEAGRRAGQSPRAGPAPTIAGRRVSSPN
eukprot:Polyplicarium_translucidae@DN4082_c0_g1_i1.p4